VQQTISDLKKRGFTMYGLEGRGGQTITKENFDKPSVFVLGNEGEGVPAYIKSVCDKLLSIPTDPKCESLNVAAAGAVAFYAWSIKRHLL
jgi:tRNA G18 (ribose-2'-O)-methylase SpoU